MFNKDAIIKVLEVKGWSKYKLCKEANMAQSTLSDILNGKAKNPNTKTLQKIADTLGVSVSDFFDDAEEGEELPDLEGEDTAEMKLLFDKIRDIPPSEQKRIIAIIRAFMEETSN
nr:MAG TPA: helix-turn-helix domain protein [Caudoviricetes sp.]